MSEKIQSKIFNYGDKCESSWPAKYGTGEKGRFYIAPKTENKSAYVQQDTMAPLRNMATGKIYDSKSAYLRDVHNAGFRVVGNDLMSEKQHSFEEKITDSLVMDRIQKAESILSDPAKRNEYRNMNQQLTERAMRDLGYK